MSGHWTTLGRILTLATEVIPILDHLYYQSAEILPYPQGITPKTIQSGFDFSKKQKKLIRAGQFVISSVEVQEAIWGIVPPQLDGAVINQNILTFDLHPELNRDYFAAYLSTSAFRKAALVACSWNGRLSRSRFKAIAIPLLSLDDQAQIVKVWQSANAALEQTAEMQIAVAQMKAGVARQLLQNVNSSWGETRLGECASIEDGIALPNAVTFLSPDEIVLVSEPANLGGVNIMPDVELDSSFLLYFLKTQRAALQATINTSQLAIEDILQTLPIPLPNLYEQRKIAMLLQQHEEALLCLHIEQEVLYELVQGVMHQIFDGTLNPQDASR